jgi:hypothetical protein
VFEANHGVGATMRVVHGVENSVIRNNVLERHDENAIIVDPYDSTYARGVSNLTIANNTVLNNGTKGKFLYVGGKASGLVFVNNLYKADNLVVGANVTAGLYVNDTSLAASGSSATTCGRRRASRSGPSTTSPAARGSTASASTPARWATTTTSTAGTP